MSRNEEIMNAIVNGTDMPDGIPSSRNEALLQGVGQVINNVKSDLGIYEKDRKSLPKLFLTGNTTGISKTTAVTLVAEYYGDTLCFKENCTLKWQGSSSLQYPKKNFTIKLENKHNVGFGNQKKYCLKANYIDHSHSRNIICAQLWNEVVASRENYNSLPQDLRESPCNGAINGYPFKLYLNGAYQGVYTFNIPKDGWMFNMDEDNINHAAICAEVNNNGDSTLTLATQFRATALLDGTDWSIEFPDTATTEIKASLNTLISFVQNNNGADFKNGISDYLDINAAIDYYLFAYFICALDGLGKNLILLTYDGTVWIPSMYDMDCTFGLFWNGQSFVSSAYACPSQYQETNSLLWQRIVDNYDTELKERYRELRAGVLSYSNVIRKYDDFCSRISKELYDEDGTIYAEIPLLSTNNLSQIRTYAKDRSAYVDSTIYDIVATNKKSKVFNAGALANKTTSTVFMNSAADYNNNLGMQAGKKYRISYDYSISITGVSDTAETSEIRFNLMMYLNGAWCFPYNTIDVDVDTETLTGTFSSDVYITTGGYANNKLYIRGDYCTGTCTLSNIKIGELLE